jgi:transcriptional regulator with XRE-family HTH domain
VATFTQWLVTQMPDIRTRDGRGHRSQVDLAMRLWNLGWLRKNGQPRMSVQSLAKIEAGIRSRVTLDEAMALALALNVAPVHLFLPRDDDADVEITSKVHARAADVRAWVRGERPVPHVDEVAYRQEVPDSERRPQTFASTLREIADAHDAAAGDSDRQQQLLALTVAMIRALRSPPDIDWRTGESETELMQMIHPDQRWKRS